MLGNFTDAYITWTKQMHTLRHLCGCIQHGCIHYVDAIVTTQMHTLRGCIVTTRMHTLRGEAARYTISWTMTNTFSNFVSTFLYFSENLERLTSPLPLPLPLTTTPPPFHAPLKIKYVTCTAWASNDALSKFWEISQTPGLFAVDEKAWKETSGYPVNEPLPSSELQKLPRKFYRSAFLTV